jgi:hypothetical protein
MAGIVESAGYYSFSIRPGFCFAFVDVGCMKGILSVVVVVVVVSYLGCEMIGR